MTLWQQNRSVRPISLIGIVLFAGPLGIVLTARLVGRASWLDFALVVTAYVVGYATWRRLTDNPDASYVAPSNLPPPPTRLVDREPEAEELKAYLLDTTVERRIANVAGVAGIGKTAFVLHVAHRAAPHFKGGELFAHFDPDLGRDQTVQIARRQFIQALRPPGARMPRWVIFQAALYRRLIRRINKENQLLVVFDDVTSAEMIRPLLPDTPWCAVIITSRRPIAATSAKSFELGRLSKEAALGMLQAIIGSERVLQEPNAANNMVKAAAYHPLAIHLVGMALANRPHTRLSVALQRMTEVDGPKTGTFDNALDLSYAMLTSGEQRALTMLGLLPQRRFAAWELGGLMLIPETEAWQFCDRLTDAGLLERRSPDVVGLQFFVLLEHVEGYAKRRCQELPAQVRETAEVSLSDIRAQRARPSRAGGVFEELQVTVEEGTISRAFKDVRDAVALARELNDEEREAEATAMLAELHAELGGLEDVRDLLSLLLRSAPRLSRIRALRVDAKLYRRLRQVSTAKQLLNEAAGLNKRQADPIERVRILRELAIAESVGSTPKSGLAYINEAQTLLTDQARFFEGRDRLRAGVAYAAGRVLQAMSLPEQALETLQAGERDADQHEQMLWRTWIVYEQARSTYSLKRYPEALSRSLQALDGFSAMRHRYGNAHCRQLIGQILEAQNDLEGAVRFFGEALETFHNCGDIWIEAEAAEQLAVVHLKSDEAVLANGLLKTADRIYRSLGADASVARVARLHPGGAP